MLKRALEVAGWLTAILLFAFASRAAFAQRADGPQSYMQRHDRLNGERFSQLQLREWNARRESPQVEAQRVAAQVAPAVAQVLVGNGGGPLRVAGSGVFVRSDGVLLTAYHTIRDAAELHVRLKNGDTFHRVEILAVDEPRDVAALRIGATGLPKLSPAAADPAEMGGRVFVVSHADVQPSPPLVRLMPLRREAGDLFGSERDEWFVPFAGALPPEASGSALVNSEGRVLGLVVGPARAGRTLNFAVPVQSVMHLVYRGRDEASAPADSRAPQFSRLSNSHTHAAELQGTCTRRNADIDPDALLRAARTIYMRPNYGIDSKYVEYKLQKDPQFRQWGLLIVEDEEAADLVLTVNKSLLNWIFSLTDPCSSAVVLNGKVVAINKQVAAEYLGREIIKRVREVRGTPSPAQPKQKRERDDDTDDN